MEALQIELVQKTIQADVKKKVLSNTGQSGKNIPALEVLGSIIAIIVGVSIYWVTGFHDALDSTYVGIGLVTVLSYIYFITFRVGLYTDRKNLRGSCCRRCGRCRKR
jgi:hypothetical protein